MKKIILLFASVTILASSVSTEKAEAQELLASLNLEVGVPVGPFKDQLDEIGFGLGGMVGIMLPETPLVVGLDLGFMTFGTDRRRTRLSSDIPDLTVTVENSYNMFHGHFLTRITSRNAAFRPYAEGLVGLNYLWTQTDVRSNVGSDEAVFSDTNFDDFAFSYGVGGGVQARIFNARGAGGLRAVYLNIQGRYMFGGEAEYLRPGAIEIRDGEAIYSPERSETNLLNFQIGIGITM